MAIVLISGSFVVLLLGAFTGAYLGYRVGLREGRSNAEMNTREHWVDLLETSISVTRSRAAHPSRGDAAVTNLTGRQKG